MKVDKLGEQYKELLSTTLFHLFFICYWMEILSTEWGILPFNFNYIVNIKLPHVWKATVQSNLNCTDFSPSCTLTVTIWCNNVNAKAGIWKSAFYVYTKK